MNDDLTHDIGTEDENPLVQSLTAMASSLTGEQSSENSSEKDVILTENNLPDGAAAVADQDTEPSDVEQELLLEQQQTSSDEEGVTLDEEIHPQMQSPTSESKTLSTSYGSAWLDDSNNPNNVNTPGRFSSTTPKGLTTWSAVNGENVKIKDNHSGENSGFKGTVQLMPSDYLISSMVGFNQKNPVTGSPPSTAPIVTKENVDHDEVSTTEIPRTTKSHGVMTRKKPPQQILINQIRMKHKKPIPSKHVKPQPENLVATEISSDDTHTTFQLKPISTDIRTSSEAPTRYTRRPGYPWPINPPVITTPKPSMAMKKAAFQKIGTGGTKRPNPYIKRTELPKLSLTTPTSTQAPPSTTVYLRTPGVPLVNAFPLTLSNMPFFDFVRSQILPRIGLSLISFMATSPLILTLLGASAVSGRKKRDAAADLASEPIPFDMSKLFLDGDKEENGSSTVKKHGALFEPPTKDEFLSKDTSSLLSKSKSSSISKKTKEKEWSKNKYGKET